MTPYVLVYLAVGLLMAETSLKLQRGAGADYSKGAYVLCVLFYPLFLAWILTSAVYHAVMVGKGKIG